MAYEIKTRIDEDGIELEICPMCEGENLAGELESDGCCYCGHQIVDPEACPGCGCKPGDGYTEGCDHPDGCGFFRTGDPDLDLD